MLIKVAFFKGIKEGITNYYKGLKPRTQNAFDGAVIGGLAGAGLGAVLDDNLAKGLTVGGLSGAALGGGIGYASPILDPRRLMTQIRKDGYKPGMKYSLFLPSAIRFMNGLERVKAGYLDLYLKFKGYKPHEFDEAINELRK